MQCGADNLQQLDSLTQHEDVTMQLHVSNYIRFSQFKYMNTLSAFDTMVDKSCITHFYCKTYPKHMNIPIPHDTVYLLEDNQSHYATTRTNRQANNMEICSKFSTAIH
jgi:hypothetical protein